VGLVLALAFTLTPTLRFMGWLVGALFHETGHVVFAWYVGCPAFPAISLSGHAAAFHRPPSVAILALVGLGLLAGVVLAFASGRLRALAVLLIAAWPLFAFVGVAREVGFLLSGHLGELVFAGIFLWRAGTGEAVEREAERPLYACLGWFLVARNVALTAGLAFQASARAAYLGNGSFGLLNDYARVASDVLHVPLASVGVFMLLVSLATVPVVFVLTGRWSTGVDLPEAPRPLGRLVTLGVREPAPATTLAGRLGAGAGSARPPVKRVLVRSRPPAL
jgi:hypothetical protein